MAFGKEAHQGHRDLILFANHDGFDIHQECVEPFGESFDLGGVGRAFFELGHIDPFRLLRERG